MQGFKTSYILTKSEALLLLSHNTYIQPTAPVLYILKEYLSDSIETEEAIEGLVFKRLARKDADKLVIEPVIEFLVKSIMTADRLWIVSWVETEKPSLIIRSHSVWLLITHYSLTQGEWKVTPFPNETELIDELEDNLFISDVAVISEDGAKYPIKHDDSFLWLKEDSNG